MAAKPTKGGKGGKAGKSIINLLYTPASARLAVRATKYLLGVYVAHWKLLPSGTACHLPSKAGRSHRYFLLGVFAPLAFLALLKKVMARIFPRHYFLIPQIAPFSMRALTRPARRDQCPRYVRPTSAHIKGATLCLHFVRGVPNLITNKWGRQEC